MVIADAASGDTMPVGCILLFLLAGVCVYFVKISLSLAKDEPADKNRGSWLLPKRYTPEQTQVQIYREDIYGQWANEGKKLLGMNDSYLQIDWQSLIAFTQIRKMAVVRYSHLKLLRIDYDDSDSKPQVVGLALTDFGLRDWGLTLQGRTGLWVENLEGRKKKAQE